MSERILIIGWSERFRKYILDAAQELGLEVYLVRRRPLMHWPPYVKDVLVLPGLYQDPMQWIDTIVSYARSHHIKAIFTQEDPLVELTAWACQMLGLPGLDPQTARRTNNKWITREILAHAGLASPSYVCVASLFEAYEALKKFRFPVVMKPIGCAGGDGASKLNDINGLDKAWQFAQHAYKKTPREYQQVIIEEFIPGPLVSVETVVVDGKSTTVAVTDCLQSEIADGCFCSRFVHQGPVLPSNLNKNIVNGIVKVAEEALLALNIETGVAHTELKVSPAGPTVIEINPRLPGVFVPELVHRATGINWAMVGLLLALGEKPNLLPRSSQKGTCVRLLIPEKDGIIASIQGYEAITQLPHVARAELWVKKGDHITTPVKGDVEERVGYILTEHNDSHNALSSAISASNLLNISFEV